jgi:hypothetical protein
VRPPQHRTKARRRRSPATVKRAVFLALVTEQYSEPESGFGILDEDVDEDLALDVEDDDKDKDVHDPYTEDEEENEEEWVLSQSSSRSSHTSRARSPNKTKLHGILTYYTTTERTTCILYL